MHPRDLQNRLRRSLFTVSLIFAYYGSRMFSDDDREFIPLMFQCIHLTVKKTSENFITITHSETFKN